MPNNLVPGTVFPDHQLPDHTGTQRRLSELQGADPLIAFYPKIAVAYTQLATISTDDHHTLLPDPGRLVQNMGVTDSTDRSAAH